MLDNLVEAFQTVGNSISEHLHIIFFILAVLWVIQIINAASGYRLNQFGILPRKKRGLFGILVSPFLHGSPSHLLFNSIPLFILSALIMVGGTTLFLGISILIILMTGIATWAWGRHAIHVGASGVIMGYWGFLLCNAYLHPSTLTIILGILCLYYLGSLFFSLFPTEERVSWEGHVFGFLSGLLTCFWINHPGPVLIWFFNHLPQIP